MPQQYGKVKISWNRNTEADLAGYIVAYGRNNVPVPVIEFTVNVGLTSTPLTPSVTLPSPAFPQDLQSFGNLFFAVAAYDTSNNVSSFSTPAVIDVAPFLMPMVWG